jgi:uncharacterized membrane protein YhaH (DUF805 family)
MSLPMVAANPYQPPRAEVADIARVSDDVQEVTLWGAAGRIGRLRYCGYLMLGWVALILSTLVVGVATAAVQSPVLGDALALLLLVVFAVWSILKSIQRAHDMGWSGWWILLVCVPFVVFVWFLKAGTGGGNAYGAPPPATPLGLKIAASLLPLGYIVSLAVGLLAYQGYVAKATRQAQRLQASPQLAR